MLSLAVTLLSLTLLNDATPGNTWWAGETSFLCEAVRRDVGPPDSIIATRCWYESWMDHFDWSGDGAWLEEAARRPARPGQNRQAAPTVYIGAPLSASTYSTSARN